MFLVTEDFKTFIRKYPITTIMVGLCTILAIITTFLGGYTIKNIINLGGYEHELVKQGEIWRLFTYAFMHGSYAHFFMNMTFMIILGRPLERALGSVKFLLFYLLSVILTGLIINFNYSPNTVETGASGVGYAFLGMYLFITLFRKKMLFSDDRKFVITFLGIGLLSSLIIPSTSLTGHLAGMIIGFMITPLLLKKGARFQNSVNI
ncbi:rhomboid family intramembrane serine protease [Gottfriedia acidiceleris]|uniref:rhomboid family intramembrane serine protease n=1 Tax=Gottfriedia acidiceleris TaxID=371036 RepID=UPI00101C2368|nr:rhomboid family intramembrane serine protease [Gottfriedia acidiceleris]